MDFKIVEEIENKYGFEIPEKMILLYIMLKMTHGQNSIFIEECHYKVKKSFYEFF